MHNHVRELRSAQGWSQAELAEHLDVSRQTINAIETGKYDPLRRRCVQPRPPRLPRQRPGSWAS